MDYKTWILIIYLIIGLIPVVYYIIEACVTEFKRKYHEAVKINRRKQLLTQARHYLEPFDNIWRYQKLKNLQVSAELKVQVINIENENKKLHIKATKQEYIDDIWDILLDNFDNNIKYEELVKVVKLSRVPLVLDEKLVKHKKTKSKTKQERLEESTRNEECLVDINNCSEMELTKLVGVNIALAKKIVIKRESIQGFKSKKEFINFIKLKPHFQNKVENSIIIKKVKVSKPIKLTKERIIDL